MSIPRDHPWPASKPAARKALIEWRDQLSAGDRIERAANMAAGIAQRLVRFQQKVVRSGNTAQCVAVFWPIRSEPDMRPHYEQWLQLGFQLALPVTPDTPAPLSFVHWQPGEAMATDRMGIQIPAQQRLVVPDVMVIPCLGYGDKALRLGYGGGYYDRTLVNFRGPSLGVAYAETFLPDLHAEPHDCPLTEIVAC